MAENVRLTPIGGLDKDTDVHVISRGRYQDGVNIRIRDNSGSDGFVVVPIKGNTLEYTFPDVVSTSVRKYRIFLSYEDYVTPKEGKCFLRDGANIYTLDFGTLPSYLNITAFFNAVKALIDDPVTGLAQHYSGDSPFLYSSFTTTGTSTGYFDITANAILNISEWVFTQDGNVFEDIQLISEHLSVVGEKLKVIGSCDVNGDLFVVSSTGPVYNSQPLTEVGVFEYSDINDSYSYKRLLQTTKMGFTQNNRVQIRAERIGNAVELYMTDRNTKPRHLKVPVLSAPVAGSYYTQDGCLTVNGGQYEFQSIDEETYLFLKSPAATIELQSVREGGGDLKSGNKRYSGRFITEDLVGTELIQFTNPVPVFPASISANKPWEISGGFEGEITDKSVRLKVDNFPAGVYKFFELVAVEYIGDSFSAVTVQRYPLDKSQSSVFVEHTGTGQENIPIATNEIVEVLTKYDKVESIAIHNGRLFAAGCREETDPDLEAWAQAITHSLEMKELDAVGVLDSAVNNSLATNVLDYRFGEYQDPINVNKFGSHMWYETYRYGIQVRMRGSGRWTRAYWVDDITINEALLGVARRTANNIVFNFTDIDNILLNSFYVKFDNIDFSYANPVKTGGKMLHEIVDAYRIVRADVIKEVLFTGVFLPGESTGSPTRTIHPHNYADASPYPTGSRSNAADYMFGYIPDIELGGYKYEYQTGDTFYNFGTYTYRRVSGSSYTLRCLSSSHSYYRDQFGYFDLTGLNSKTSNRSIDEAFTMSIGSTVVTNSGSDIVKLNDGNVWLFKPNVTLKLSSAPSVPANGLMYGFVFRNLGGAAKYPANKELTVYRTCGHFAPVEFNDAVKFCDVYGDVYNQKTHIHLAISNYNTSHFSGNTGLGTSFYSQNYVNSQLRYVIPDDAGYLFPQFTEKTQHTGGSTYANGTTGNGLAYWLEQWPDITKQNKYDNGYNFGVPPIQEPAYDPNDTYDGDNPGRIHSSQRKQTGSQRNNYRIFKPADFIDLDITKGRVSHIENINGALYSWQLNSFRRLFSNETALAQDPTGIEIVLGTGGVLQNSGVEISSIGTDKKWSIILGRSVNGKTTAYWYNDQQRKVVRFGLDGTNVISNNGLRSFFTRNANFLRDKFEHVTGEGIHGVWNERHQEAIFTFKAFKGESTGLEEYTGGSYVIGDLVFNWNSVGPNGLPYIYRAKVNFTVNGDEEEPGVGVDWEDFWDGPFDETDYPQFYTCFTIAWDELENVWRSYHTYWPDIYLEHLNNFLSPNPVVPHTLYVHDKGSQMTFYGNNYEGHVTPVLNWEANTNKIYEAFQVASDLIPYKIQLSTRTHTSELLAADFASREEYHWAAIKNNSVAGVTTGDSSRLFGRYLAVKFVFQNGIAQRLNNMITKLRLSPRLYNQ